MSYYPATHYNNFSQTRETNNPKLRSFSRIEQASQDSLSKKSLVMLALSVFSLIMLSGVFVNKLTASSKKQASTDKAQIFSESFIADTADNKESDNRPQKAQVAGLNSVADQSDSVAFSEEENDFTLVKSTSENNNCSELLLKIGEREKSATSHPADELSWVGALDVVPSFTNPFILEVHSDNYFPWRVDSDQPDTQDTLIIFDYDGKDTEVLLNLGWSPGTTGASYKQVLLNDTMVGTTRVREGRVYTQPSWNNLMFFNDKIRFNLEKGKNQLKIVHHDTQKGDSAVWDYLELLACN